MGASAKVYISDTLVIKALNTPGGSGGVAKDMNETQRRIRLRAYQYAVGELASNPLNYTKPGANAPGTYARSFHSTRRGNGHILVRTVYNSAPHAGVVETGRVSTQFGHKIWIEGIETGHYGYDKLGKSNGIRYTYIHKAYGSKLQHGKAALFGKWETFGWSAAGGQVRHYAGTSGRAGRLILTRALLKATKKYTKGMVAGGMQAAGSVRFR